VLGGGVWSRRAFALGIAERAAGGGLTALAALAGVNSLACGWGARPGLVEVRGETMGSTYALKAIGRTPSALDPEDVARHAVAILSELDVALSTWRDDSEIMALNAAAKDAPFSASAHLFEVLRIAGEVSAQTGGAFDVTLAPVIRAWGFGGAEQIVEAPRDLERLRASVGWDALVLDEAARSVTKTKPGMLVDVSAIAPGYAADRLAAVLGELGAIAWMVEVGGEVTARGKNLQGEGWRIGIERPTGDMTRALQAIVAPGDAALATSGDYRNYYEVEGRRVSHTIDPRTGRPIEHTLASVTLVDPRSCAHADATATALNVLGPTEGFATAERLQLAAYFIVREGDGFVTRHTPAFAPLIVATPSP
jgi:thiamine biosynthesis lipoprotein